MDPAAHSEALPAGQVLVAAAAQLRVRRDDLQPLVAEYDRVREVHDAIGELPAPEGAVGDDTSPRGAHAVLVGHLGQMRDELRAWTERLEPLVMEYEQILHVLAAFEAAEATPPDVRRGRRRTRGRGPSRRSGSPRLDELRAHLAEPRTRAQLAQRMSLSPSRVSGLLDELAQNGEVVEIRDAEQPSRKLWALAEPPVPPSDAQPVEPVAGAAAGE